jgi:hypothetical protein
MRFLFLLFLFFPFQSYAQDTGALISGDYLYQVCERDENGKEIIRGGHTTCQAYIAGLIDYHHLLRSLGTAPSIDICVPNTVKLADLQDVVWQYLEDNKHHAAFNAAPAVGMALFEIFPCPGAVGN